MLQSINRLEVSKGVIMSEKIDREVVNVEVKNIIIDVLNLDPALAADVLTDQSPLLGGGLQLDSIVALEILVLLETRFAFELEDDDFTGDLITDVEHLTNFVCRKLQLTAINGNEEAQSS